MNALINYLNNRLKYLDGEIKNRRAWLRALDETNEAEIAAAEDELETLTDERYFVRTTIIDLEEMEI
jgi:hypothetical protein